MKQIENEVNVPKDKLERGKYFHGHSKMSRFRVPCRVNNLIQPYKEIDVR